MKSNPKVSIVVPVYKVEKYIHLCMKTLLNQTLKDIEIILVDDGSPDNCGKICDDYAKLDNRVKVVHQTNGRQGKARNNGVKFATGEYIGFVDSDDWVDVKMYEELYTKAKSTNADIVMCDYFRIKAMGEKPTSYKSKIDKVFLEKDVFNVKNLSASPSRKSFFSIVVCWNKIFKRDFYLKNVKFPENLIFEDSPPMFFAFAKADRISVVDKKLYFYRISNQNSMSLSSDKKVLDLLKILKLNLDNLNILDYNLLRKTVISSLIRDAVHKLKRLEGDVKQQYIFGLRDIVEKIKQMNLYDYITLKDKVRLWFYLYF